MKYLTEEIDSVALLNIKPKSKIPYLWKLETLNREDNVLIRLCSFADSDSARVPRVGDKTLVVYFMSLSPAGSASMLKQGMGYKPVDSIKVIFNEILKIVRRYKVDLLIFKFPEGRMKGQEAVLKKVIEILAKNQSRGLLEVIESDQDVYLKSKNKEVMTSEQIKEYLSTKTYTSVVQKTRLTIKELILANNGYAKPSGVFKDDEDFDYKIQKPVNVSEQQLGAIYEAVLARLDDLSIVVPREFKDALQTILEANLSNIKTLHEVFSLARTMSVSTQVVNIVEELSYKQDKTELSEGDQYIVGSVLESGLDEFNTKMVSRMDRIIENYSVPISSTLYMNLPITELENLEKGIMYFKEYKVASFRPDPDPKSILMVIETSNDHCLVLDSVILPRGALLVTEVHKHSDQLVCEASILGSIDPVDSVVDKKEYSGFSVFVEQNNQRSVYNIL